ncbi:replication initiation protein [uncultured Clostridium sp.]|uniref:replication initiation protein n=1 Tax=uncultured Clostridium sp. TaxID=59620 RepID=UPI00261D6109|nr:replication initiation protein [uncultured Clostridium sp.]
MGYYEQIQLRFEQMDNDKYIFKSNNLVESSCSLSLNAQRLIYMGAKKLKPIYIKSDIELSQLNSFLATQTFDNLKIYVTDFKREFNIKGNYLYETLVDAAKELFNSKIQYLSNDGKIIEKRWVIECEYEPEDCYINLIFHPDLILDLLVFQNKYNKLQHDVYKVLKNSDQIRTYELLKRYVKKGVRRFELQDYRYKLSYDDDIYPEYAKLKQRKIKPTIEAINKNTDIEIYDYKEIRYGRKVGAIEFYIRDNKK